MAQRNLGILFNKKMYVSALFSVCKDAVINLWLWGKNSSINLFPYLPIKVCYICYNN